MIEVLHMSTALDGGGVEMFLLNYYKNIDRSKIHFSIVVPGKKKGILENQFIELGAEIYHVELLRNNPIKTVIDIYKIIKVNKFDIVHCHGNKSSLLGIIIGKICGIKIRIVHAHMTEEVVTYFKKPYKLFTRLIIKMFSTNLFACGCDAGNYLFGRSGFTVIHNAIDLDRFLYNAKIRNDYREDLGLVDKIVLGNVARFSTQKNHMFLIDVFCELLKVSDKYKLVLVGDGNLKKEIMEKCLQRGITKNIVFIGNTNHVNDIMQAFDIGILPSLYEGLPVVAVEMQAAGLPVICSDSITKEVNITKTITYVSLSLTSSEWAHIISTNALNCAEVRKKQNYFMKKSNYDIKLQAQNLEILYEELISENNRNKKR